MRLAFNLTYTLIFMLILGGLGCYSSFKNPPPNFKEADLFGTWQAIYGFVQTDTITIKPDGTYQQIYYELDDFVYKSPWNEWYVEYTPEGKTYLHLRDMRYYVLGRELYDATAKTSPPRIFYDANTDRTISITGEVVLAITGVSDTQASQGIILLHLVPDPDMPAKSFILQEQ